MKTDAADMHGLIAAALARHMVPLGDIERDALSADIAYYRERVPAVARVTPDQLPEWLEVLAEMEEKYANADICREPTESR